VPKPCKDKRIAIAGKFLCFEAILLSVQGASGSVATSLLIALLYGIPSIVSRRHSFYHISSKNFTKQAG